VKLGAGGGAAQLTEFVPGSGSAQGTTFGLGLEAGIGYDIHTGSRFSLTPYADLLYQAPSNLIVNGSNTGFPVSTNLLHVGLAASWR